MPSVPTPAAARYIAAGEPRPPAPSSSTFELEQLRLALDADLGQQQVAVIRGSLLGVQLRGHRPLATLVLPPTEAARHRHHVGVAELAERLRRECGPRAAGAVDDDAACRGRGPCLRSATRGGHGGCGCAPGSAPCSYSSGSRTSSSDGARQLAQVVGSRRCRPRGSRSWPSPAARGSWTCAKSLPARSGLRCHQSRFGRIKPGAMSTIWAAPR